MKVSEKGGEVGEGVYASVVMIMPSTMTDSDRYRRFVFSDSWQLLPLMSVASVTRALEDRYCLTYCYTLEGLSAVAFVLGVGCVRVCVLGGGVPAVAFVSTLVNLVFVYAWLALCAPLSIHVVWACRECVGCECCKGSWYE